MGSRYITVPDPCWHFLGHCTQNGCQWRLALPSCIRFQLIRRDLTIAGELNTRLTFVTSTIHEIAPLLDFLNKNGEPESLFSFRYHGILIDILPTGGFKLIERAPGISVEQIRNATQGRLMIEGDIPEMIL